MLDCLDEVCIMDENVEKELSYVARLPSSIRSEGDKDPYTCGG